jgi:hypothetical protein
MLIKTLIILTFSFSLSFGQEESKSDNGASKTAGEDIIEYVDVFHKSYHYQIGGVVLGLYGASNPIKNRFGDYKVNYLVYMGAGLQLYGLFIHYTGLYKLKSAGEKIKKANI